jgi:hypothetical protein
MTIRTVKVAVTTTGSAGAATGTAYSDRPLNGTVRQIRVDWSASAPATSDIDVVGESDADHPQVTLYDKDDANSDVWVYPKVQSTDVAGAAIANEYQFLALSGQRIKVVVGQCDALDPAVTVYVSVEG